MSKEVAFKLGFNSFQNSKGRNYNPYAFKTELWYEWESGYDAAMEVDIESAKLQTKEEEKLQRLQSKLFAIESFGNEEDAVALREQVELLQRKLSKAS